ncbi:HNH endonuclease [Gimesia maris]|uniref:HNH endonuclease n=1 Tax=Gimesia maris TaxID=122 RepID=UPI003A930C13
MPSHWVIAPYHYDRPDVWQQVWALNLKEDFISLGWRWMGDVSGLTKQEVVDRYSARDPNAPSGRIASDAAMLYKFHNEIAVGDRVIARAGRKSIAAIGTVSQSAYFDEGKAISAFPDNEAYPNHIDVQWDPEPRDLVFNDQVFGLMALHSTSQEKLSELLAEFGQQNLYPDEVDPQTEFPEGSVTSTRVNAYERNPKARAECLSHHGYRCFVCDMTFAERYGEIGLNFIHVHHLRPLSETKGKRTVDARRDLVPVCPNCHAMMHRSTPPLTVKQLQTHIASAPEADG